MALFPIHVELQDRLCVIVGGGPVAERRAESLLACGARVTVIAPKATPAIEQLAASGKLTWHKAHYDDHILNLPLPLVSNFVKGESRGGGVEQDSPPNLGAGGPTWGPTLVIAATDNADVNRQVATDARQRGILVCRTDDAKEGDFIVPAHVRRGALLIDVSTSGVSPTVTAVLRDRLYEQFGPEWDLMMPILANLRPDIQKLGGEEMRRKAVSRVLEDADVIRLLATNDLHAAEARARECLLSLSV